MAEPLALPMLLQMPEPTLASESVYWQLGAQQLNDLRRQYRASQKHLAELKAALQSWQTTGVTPAAGMAAIGAPISSNTTLAQLKMEINALQSQIKDMEKQYPFLTDPGFMTSNLEQLAAQKFQQDIERGLLTPEEAGKGYAQVQSYLQSSTPSTTIQSSPTNWQQAQQATPQTQPTTSNLPWAAQQLGLTQEAYNSLPSELQTALPYIALGQNPPSAQTNNLPGWWPFASPQQQQHYINQQSGTNTWDPVALAYQWFAQMPEREKQRAAEEYQRQQLALAQQELQAQIANQQAQQAYQQQALAQAQAQFEAQLAAQQAQAQAELEQRKREMAAQIGQYLTQQQSQNWATGLPYVLPTGTTTPPGFEAGGPVNILATLAGQQNYTPMQIRPSEAPSMSQMQAIINQAISHFK